MRFDESCPAKVYCVILHYNAFNDTVKCIESVLMQRAVSVRTEVKVIVVDNGSSNESGRLLNEKYGCGDGIRIILEKENRGFACGNNIGYRCALKDGEPDFIILMNNDIEIQQENFFDTMAEVFEKQGFGVCGPDIYSPYKGIYQNPLREQGYGRSDLKRLIKVYRKNIRLFTFLKLTGTYPVFHRAKTALCRRRKARGNQREKSGVVLHGAFLILGPEYIRHFPEGLYPGTFMYLEEGILHYLCREQGLKLLFSPELKVIHNEGTATRTVLPLRVDKALFEFEQTIISARVFLRLMDEREGIKDGK